MTTTWTEAALSALEFERKALWSALGTSNRTEFLIRECRKNGGVSYAKTAEASWWTKTLRLARLNKAIGSLSFRSRETHIGYRSVFTGGQGWIRRATRMADHARASA